MDFARRIPVFVTLVACLCGVSLAVPTPEDSDQSSATSEPLDVAAVYKEKCLRCHGTHGQGTSEGYSKPLRTDQTLQEIAKVIEETMPEEDPESARN